MALQEKWGNLLNAIDNGLLPEVNESLVSHNAVAVLRSLSDLGQVGLMLLGGCSGCGTKPNTLKTIKDHMADLCRAAATKSTGPDAQEWKTLGEQITIVEKPELMPSERTFLQSWLKQSTFLGILANHLEKNAFQKDNVGYPYGDDSLVSPDGVIRVIANNVPENRKELFYTSVQAALRQSLGRHSQYPYLGFCRVVDATKSDIRHNTFTASAVQVQTVSLTFPGSQKAH